MTEALTKMRIAGPKETRRKSIKNPRERYAVNSYSGGRPYGTLARAPLLLLITIPYSLLPTHFVFAAGLPAVMLAAFSSIATVF